MGASAASHENLPFLVGWRSQAVDGPDEPECTGKDGLFLHKGDRSGQIISSLGRQARTSYIFIRETDHDRSSLHYEDRSGEGTYSFGIQARTGQLFLMMETGQKGHIFIRETGQRQAIPS